MGGDLLDLEICKIHCDSVITFLLQVTTVRVRYSFPAVINSRKAQGAVLSTSRDARLTVWSGSIDRIVIQHFVEVCYYQYVIPLPRYHWSLDTGLFFCLLYSSRHP